MMLLLPCNRSGIKRLFAAVLVNTALLSKEPIHRSRVQDTRLSRWIGSMDEGDADHEQDEVAASASKENSDTEEGARGNGNSDSRRWSEILSSPMDLAEFSPSLHLDLSQHGTGTCCSSERDDE